LKGEGRVRVKHFLLLQILIY